MSYYQYRYVQLNIYSKILSYESTKVVGIETNRIDALGTLVPYTTGNI